MLTAEYESRLPTYRAVLAACERAWETWQQDPSPRSFAVVETGIEILYRELAKPGKFELGQVLMTPGPSEALLTAQHVPPEFLLRHKHGDWGNLCAEDARENERSLRVGSRLLSAYRTRREEKLWVITEWDRSATTVLLPAEYWPMVVDEESNCFVAPPLHDDKQGECVTRRARAMRRRPSGLNAEGLAAPSPLRSSHFSSISHLSHFSHLSVTPHRSSFDLLSHFSHLSALSHFHEFSDLIDSLLVIASN